MSGAGHQHRDVLLSNGAVFSAPTVWSVEDDGDQGWYVGDFNGDGKDDILRSVNGVSGAQVFTSNGVNFNNGVSWTDSWNGNLARWFVGDFNGDGMDDILRMLTGQTDADVFLSTGAGFSYAGSWLNTGPSGIPWSVGNFDGNGSSDILRYVTSDTSTDVFLT